MNKWLYSSAIFGIFSLMLAVPIGIIDTLKAFDIIELGNSQIYLSIYILSILFYIIFVFGFILIGRKLNNKRLIYSAYLLILGSIILNLIQITSPFFPKLMGFAYQAATFLVLGMISVFFGSVLMKLNIELGNISKTAGILNIIGGISMMTIIFSFIGTILLIPIYILEIVLLFRVSKKF
ncbi:hypothetical protein HYU23_00940 [Candidatus Woesearchaeota archaeon]|nr:hypothetical protein [Candidatus Woesearchaeota archaeon]